MLVGWPWVIVWLDWNLYAYWESLVVSICLVSLHRWVTVKGMGISLDGVLLILFISFSLWVVWCALRHGYAVG